MPRTAARLMTYMFPIGHWGLIRQLVAREIALRYRQSWLGTAWLLLTPMLMLAVYTVVFRHVLNLRWPGSSGTDGGDLAFAANLFSGLLVFNFFSECVGRAPRLVLDQPHLVKKVVFPLQVLAWTNLLQALVGLVVSLGPLVLARLIDGAELAPAMLTLPLIWLPLAMLVLGLGWILSAVGTYIRDIGQVVGLATSVLLFVSPIFFPATALPAGWQPWLQLNPLTTVIEQTRQVVMVGAWPDWGALGSLTLVCTALAGAGAAFFHRVRAGFADVV